MKSKLVRLLTAILIVAGIGVIAYPYTLQHKYTQQATQDYKSFVKKISQAPIVHAGQEQKQEQDELYLQMLQYNNRLYENGQSELTDPWAYEQASFNLTEYGFDENVIGFIEIPKIEVVLPIYLGASTENMKKGAVHLSQTSLPIGGANTNSVIAGHRGYYGAVFFKYLVELKEGDEVIVTNLWESLKYEVTQTTTILDTEADKLKIKQGADMLSLFTCINQFGRKDRFVAYCQRQS